MKKCVAILMILLFIGCTFKPTTKQIMEGDFNPYPENYEKITKDFFHDELFDPSSAVFTFGIPARAIFVGYRWGYGWVVCGTLNEKDRDGDYIGVKDFSVDIYEGKAFDYTIGYLTGCKCSHLNK